MDIARKVGCKTHIFKGKKTIRNKKSKTTWKQISAPLTANVLITFMSEKKENELQLWKFTSVNLTNVMFIGTKLQEKIFNIMPCVYNSKMNTYFRETYIYFPPKKKKCKRLMNTKSRAVVTFQRKILRCAKSLGNIPFLLLGGRHNF